MSTELAVSCFPREVPTFDNVLNDNAPYPYSLKSLKDYVSQNHCSEPLEFLEDLERYKQTYRFALGLDGSCRPSRPSITPQLLLTWRNLLSLYILPGSEHELNLSTEERDALLQYHDASFPPSPSLIEEAVARISQSLESSIFLPYLTSRAILVHAVPLENPSLDEHGVGMICHRGSISTIESELSEGSSEELSPTTYKREKSWRQDKSVVLRKVLSLLGQPARSRSQRASQASSSHNRDR
ncbi:hypothetical protein BDV26DRAFT_170304 [Aspergillus bertholletiae]|uniref:RGS domain-containing protein n=1 Tax=Aspergillus bertholletiae TaxID=1226010 RepID=A0A5N7BCI2_9EURO|nr:hypothetical protein BDV26DRAFT_170304 [Aspergillus bertholletiae]